MICLDYVLRTAVDPLNKHGLTLKSRLSKRFPATLMTDADYADDLALFSDTFAGATALLHALEEAASAIGLYINAKRQKA